jgi:hypothetical protein
VLKHPPYCTSAPRRSSKLLRLPPLLLLYERPKVLIHGIAVFEIRPVVPNLERNLACVMCDDAVAGKRLEGKNKQRGRRKREAEKRRRNELRRSGRR